MSRAYGITNAAPYASAPAVGAAGDTYWNSAGKVLYVSDGTAWVAAGPGTGGPPSGAIASGDLAGSSYPNPVIAAGAVTTAKHADAPSGLTTAKVNDLAITTAKLAAGAVDYSKRTERTHGARVWRAAALSVASGANVTITFDTVDHNEAAAGGGVLWSAAAPDRLTVQASGVYLVSATLGFNASAAGSRRDLWIDCGFIAGRATSGVPNIPINMTVTVVAVLNVGAVISLLVYQDSGAALAAVSSFGALPSLTAIRLG
jgi:hypothetical protein